MRGQIRKADDVAKRSTTTHAPPDEAHTITFKSEPNNARKRRLQKELHT